MIFFDRVSLRYPNGVQALRDVTLRIRKGEFLFIVGPTGSGKSSILKLVYMDARPTSGHVYMNGLDLATLSLKRRPFIRRQMGIIFQDFKLLPDRNVWENVAFALRVIQVSEREIKQRVGEILHFVNLAHKATSFPDHLSGGEQQRVCIARAMVNQPLVLFADEPTGNLDPDTTRDVMRLLERINKRGTTVVMATHNSSIVNEHRRRVVAVVDGQVTSDVEEGLYAYESA